MTKIIEKSPGEDYSMGMGKGFLKDALGWGLGLWLFGYVLGIVLFPLVPHEQIGWYIMPAGILITLWVLLKKVKGTLRYYLKLAAVWTVIAVVFDYLFLVLVFKPADGYYKPDVYLYYALTFLLPFVIGWKKNSRTV